jgi:signal transduction histidine kinase
VPEFTSILLFSRSNGYGKQVPITFSVASEVCSEVITDEEWLWQMLLNLLTNACKYTDKGSIHVAISVSCEVALPAASDESTIGDARPGSPRPVALLFEVVDTGKASTFFDY